MKTMKMLPFQTAVYDLTQNHHISALKTSTGTLQLLTFSLENRSFLLVIDEENGDAYIREEA